MMTDFGHNDIVGDIALRILGGWIVNVIAVVRSISYNLDQGMQKT